MSTLFFAGSFDPFTIGHKDIAERGLAQSGRVIIGVGYNCAKRSRRSVEERVAHIREVFAGVDGIEVVSYTGLTAVAASEHGADAMLRGVRDSRDFDYERTIADVNRSMFGIDTVLLFADPQLASVSSSMVNELSDNGCDVSRFIP